MSMEDGYVDINEVVASYEYVEEQPEEFDDNFFNLINQVNLIGDNDD